MKKIKYKIGWILVLVLLLNIGLVNALGISNPLPTSLQLLRRESGRFAFQIQSVANPRDIICNYGVKGETPLIVEFDDPETFVAAGTIKDVLGTITAPKDIGYGMYKVKLCVNCGSAVAITGGASAVRTSACDLPIDVYVVKVRTKGNVWLPPKPRGFPYLIVIGAVIVVLIITALLIYYIYRRRNIHHKKRKK